LVCNNGTRNMLVVNYMCRMWHKYYFLCNFLITLFNPFRSIFIRSSNVLIIYVKSIIYIYSAAIYYNSDIVVMSRGNKKKNSLTPFYKRQGILLSGPLVWNTFWSIPWDQSDVYICFVWWIWRVLWEFLEPLWMSKRFWTIFDELHQTKWLVGWLCEEISFAMWE